jgi:RNA polymerase sigma factor (sigma-70 family)
MVDSTEEIASEAACLEEQVRRMNAIGCHGMSPSRLVNDMAGNRAGAARAAETFIELRPLLFSIAYRMLGSAAEAEDVVQHAFLRWHRTTTEGAEVDSAKSYLAATVTRLAIDQLRRAKTRRETYVGPWLPDPLVAGTEEDVAEQAEMADSLSMAFLVLLEDLKPVGTGGVPAPRGLRVRLPGDRGDRPEERGELPAGLRPRARADRGGDASVRSVGRGGRRARAAVLRSMRATFLIGLFEQGRAIGARLELARVNGQPGALA